MRLNDIRPAQSPPLLSDAHPDTLGQELEALTRRLEEAEAKLESTAAVGSESTEGEGVLA